MGSLPYEPHLRDDSKGGARPPLDTPAGPLLVLFVDGHSHCGKGKSLSDEGRSIRQGPALGQALVLLIRGSDR